MDELDVLDVYVQEAQDRHQDGHGKQEAMLQIEQDIHRTFSNLKLFKPGSDLHGHLRTVLGAFVIHRPDVGYVQGMSYLAGMFLLYMDPPEVAVLPASPGHFFLPQRGHGPRILDVPPVQLVAQDLNASNPPAF